MMEDASSLRCGCVVHSPWIHKQFYRGKVVFPGTACLRGGRVPTIAGLPTLWDAGKGNFHIILFKTQRFFMPDKCFQKIKIHPMRSSGSHGICRIKVMMAAFQAILNSIVKRQPTGI